MHAYTGSTCGDDDKRFFLVRRGASLIVERQISDIIHRRFCHICFNNHRGQLPSSVLHFLNVKGNSHGLLMLGAFCPLFVKILHHVR